MRKLIIALGTLAFMGGAAWAGSAEGVVKEFNKDTKVITLEDGKSYTVPADIAIPAEVAAGAKVSIAFDGDDPTKVTSVTVAM